MDRIDRIWDVVDGLDGLVGGPVAAPGIPRSRRSAGSRPFRRAKGAFAPEPLGFWRLGCV